MNDYKILNALGIGGSREAIPWPMADKNGKYDFSCIDIMIDAMNVCGIVPIWDFCHYGYPEELDPFSEKFVQRFAEYAAAAAIYVSQKMKGPYYFTAINEITYFSFIGGLWAWVAPYRSSRADFESLRLNLCKAAIAAVKAIRSVLRPARFVHPDPLVEIVAPGNNPALDEVARHETFVDTYFAWDVLAGKLYPELGGGPEVLDIVGVNNYTAGYAEYTESGPHKPLNENDKRIIPFFDLLKIVWERYKRPIIVSETSGVADKRVSWMKDIMEEVLAAINVGMDIQGVCFFPAIGSPSWEYKEWVQSGFYDVEQKGTVLERILNQPYVEALLYWQKQLKCVTMLPDQPLNEINILHNAQEAADKLKPTPDRDWHR